jgi:filamentous hemagglutinin
VDDVAHFDEAKIDTTTVSADQIAVRELRMAVPASTTPLQWAEIARAMEYGKSQGVAVIVTGVK